MNEKNEEKRWEMENNTFCDKNNRISDVAAI